MTVKVNSLILTVFLLSLTFLNICSTRVEVDVSSGLEPKCAQLLLTNGPKSKKLFPDKSEKNATFSLGINEESHASFGQLVDQEFEGLDFSITATLRLNCSVLLYMKGNWLGYLLNKDKQQHRVKLGLSVKSMWCFYGRSSPLSDECPSQSECPPGESNDISLAGQCARGYQEPFCGSCRSGYLVMTPRSYYHNNDPQFRSVRMGKGCHLWNGDKRINTTSPENLKTLYCNCSASGEEGEKFLSHSTTPNLNLTKYLSPTLVVIVVFIGSFW